ncbi:hypothetical protein HMPREF1978_01869 [Actinomyces graevenitzii F0530]|uniref:Uncharacterized protein n=1 Tax=Actinomyces graevenitzii F0530 TaxID=1321817 RepID=U1R6Z4_9ACTO|nr:hypothetical protein HMPREF1978_01869 [Actinomyces graevenitzii F0530]
MSRAGLGLVGAGPGFPRSRGDEPVSNFLAGLRAGFSPLTRG